MLIHNPLSRHFSLVKSVERNQVFFHFNIRTFLHFKLYAVLILLFPSSLNFSVTSKAFTCHVNFNNKNCCNA